jgi:hypothetical protein
LRGKDGNFKYEGKKDDKIILLKHFLKKNTSIEENNINITIKQDGSDELDDNKSFENLNLE